MQGQPFGCVLVLALGLALPAEAQQARRARGAAAAQEERAPSPLEKAAQRIDEQLTELDAKYEAFLEDPWLRLAKRHLGLAQLAATQIVKEGAVVPHAVNRFHNYLDEFLRALDTLEGYRPNTTGQSAELRSVNKPSLRTAKQLAADLRKLKASVNATQGLREIALVELGPGSTAQEAVLYGNLVIDKIDVILYSRGLGQITGDGRRRTHEELGVFLHELRMAISGMVDESGARVPQMDSSGETKLRDQLANVKRCLDDTEKMARIFRKSFPHAEARIGMAQDELARLRKNVLRPKALME